MPDSIGAVEENNQVFLQHTLHFCSASGRQKLAGKRYDGKTLSNQTYAHRHIYLIFNLIGLNIPVFEQNYKMSSVKVKYESM